MDRDEIDIEWRTRFTDAEWFPRNNEKALVGGAGGIGSWLSFFLARIGYEVTLYDPDFVETHNIGGQMFKPLDVGKPKVAAMSDTIQDFSGVNINTFRDSISDFTVGHHFAFSAFDNMEARKAMFNIWKRTVENCTVAPILIDGRLELEQLQIFCVTKDTMDQYEETKLFDDAHVPDMPCNLKQTTHSAAMIASLMTGFFTNHLTNIYYGKIIRTVPYYYEYYIPASLTVQRL